MRDEVLSRLVDTALEPVPSGTHDALRLLTGDFLACAAAGGASRVTATDGGVTDLAADLARRASARDLDDVDWGCVTHPGSVVQAAVLASAIRSNAPGDIATALSVGYRVTGDLSLVLGPQYRRIWHATAICGVVGAAAAVSMLLDPQGDSLVTAMSLASLAAGGRSQAVIARNGAAGFNRQSAVATAVLAAQAARRGDPGVPDPFTGDGGMVEALGLDSVTLDARRHDGPSEASLRLFPVTGFAHGAVLAASSLTDQATGEVTGIRVQVAAPAARLSTPGTSGWWDIATAVRRAFSHGDPFACATDVRDPGVAVEVVVDEVGIGAATVVAMSSDGPSATCHAGAPGGVSAPETEALWRQKCERVLHCDADATLRLADRVLADGIARGSDLQADIEALARHR